MAQEVNRKIERALISVYNKEGLKPLLETLSALNVEFISTGGTQRYIEEAGYPCRKVEDLTGFPAILGGRVKTLHPTIFGGILARRELEQDRAEMQQHAIESIDLVVVDLYPFEEG